MVDQLFQTKQSSVESFVFDEAVADVFDDMVARSVPFYGEIHSLILDLMGRVFSDSGAIYDLGCSTGTTICLISEYLKKRQVFPIYVGIDNSPSMISKCQDKLTTNRVSGVTLCCQNIEEVVFENPEVVIMNYTLQFIPPQDRPALLKKIYDSLLPGGLFILSEKIVSESQEINNLLTDLYYDFKRRNGYSELEIAQKREALENVLVPITPESQIRLLKEAGFRKTDICFRWYNFCSYVGIKCEN